MTLIVPTDFSKNARKAIDFALEIADRVNTEILLLHAYQVIDTESTSRKLLFEEYNNSIARKLHAELKMLRNRIARINPAIKISAELSGKPTRKAIIEACAPGDLIIMGTQGASGLKRIFMGSVTANIIGNTIVPVLAIPRSYRWKNPENILLAINRFEQAQANLDPVIKMTVLFDAMLHVIVFSDTDSVDESEMQRQNQHLELFREDLLKSRKGISITAAHLRGSDFEETLQQYIDGNNIGMLAMITQKRSLLESIFNRSKTRKMAYRTQIPLLAIPDTKD